MNKKPLPEIHLNHSALNDAEFEKLLDGLPAQHPKLTSLELQQLRWQLRGQRAEALKASDRLIYKSAAFAPGIV